MASRTERSSTPPGDTARLYHRLSSYAYVPGELDPRPADHALVRQDFIRNNLPTFPAPFKAYAPGLPRVALPRRWPSPRIGATSVLAGMLAPASNPPDVMQIARILYLSAAVVRFAERADGRRFFFRDISRLRRRTRNLYADHRVACQFGSS